ncbi:hypothetical protein SAY87_025447 [Trapa incisa]|uniref:Myb-like domain-containing protein n=1 Tax=Trapa incisa TaxID=236973 RepID=A0AAN7GHP9_9MYRT|nr:hypothetical protein SAY87_025447 [Trapa incisa]
MTADITAPRRLPLTDSTFNTCTVKMQNIYVQIKKGYPVEQFIVGREGEKKQMKMVQDKIRKGPWTEEEDYRLVCFVRLFGDRRWDFIAKVSGLKVEGDHNR